MLVTTFGTNSIFDLNLYFWPEFAIDFHFVIFS